MIKAKRWQEYSGVKRIHNDLWEQIGRYRRMLVNGGIEKDGKDPSFVQTSKFMADFLSEQEEFFEQLVEDLAAKDSA